jgi:hypothetical protein
MKNPMTGERTHRECLKDAELDPGCSRVRTSAAWPSRIWTATR